MRKDIFARLCLISCYMGISVPVATAAPILNLTFDGSNGSTSFGPGITSQGNPYISTSQSVGGGSSLYLDGNSSITVNNSGLSLGTSGFNISFDMRTDGPQQAYSVILSQGTGAWPPAFYANIEIGNPSGFNNGNFFVSLTPWESGSITSSAMIISPNINNGEWHHISFNRIGSSVNLVLDGSVIGTAPFSATAPVNIDGFRLGRWQGNNLSDNVYKGWIDNLSISTVPNSTVPEPGTIYLMLLAITSKLSGLLKRKIFC